jgi:puromycin-sensitive aminopeptidase
MRCMTPTSASVTIARTVALVLACSAPAFADRLPRTVIPSHYDLAFGPDFTKDDFTGEETIAVEVKSTTTAVTLHAAEIEFKAVEITSGGRTQTATVRLDEEQETATLTVAGAVPAGPASIHIRFVGRLNDKLRGFYLSQANNRKYAVTQFEATDARRAFPCFDEPDLKATFSVKLTIDRGDTAISNGRQTSDTPGPGAGKHTVTFDKTARMSTYLVAMVVGDFVCRSGEADGIPVRVCSTPDKRALTAFALESAIHEVRFFNNYFGIRYPFGKLDIIGVPDFAAGAMENTGAITFRETFLLADPATASLEVRKTIAAVVSHEIAHQWFGDLVTMKWWDDIWLNEGFATWMANKPLEAWRPEWRVELDDAEEIQTALNVDALQSTRPIRSKMETPAEINEGFDAIAYQKGASVLRMIEAYVGPDVFRRGTAAYLRKYSYGNAASEDFWAEISRASGKPIIDIAQAFVVRPGAPLISVTSSCNGSTTAVTLSQERFAYDAESTGTDTWKVPVCMKRPGAAAPMCVVLAERQQTFTMPGCSPFVFANAGAHGYYRTAYPPEVVARLSETMTESLKAPERLALFGDEWALVRRGTHDVGDFLTLAEGASRERTSSVMEIVEGRLAAIGEDLATDAVRDRYRAWVRRTFSPALQSVGWSPAPGESDDRKALRATLVRLIGAVGRDPETIATARTLVARYVKDPMSVEPTLADAVLAVAPIGGDAALYEQYLRGRQAATRPDERSAFQNNLTGFTSPDLVRRTLEFALSPEVRTQDSPSLLARAIANPESADAAWSFVKAHWADLERTGTFQGIPQIVGATAAFCDQAHYDDVKQFFETHKVPTSEQGIRRALENITHCMSLKAAQQDKLAAWLNRNSQ